MPTVAIALCRAGFEGEAAADLGAIAAHARTTVDAAVAPGSASVIARIEHADASAWRRAVHAHPPIFVRSLWTGTGPHTIAPPRSAGRPDRITPLAAAFAELASMPGHRRRGCRRGSSTPTRTREGAVDLARSLDARLAGALRERGFVADDARRRPHVLLVDGATACVGTADPDIGSPWPLGIPRLRMPREAPSRSTQKLAEAIAVFLGGREQSLMHEGQAAVDLGAAPGGWTWQLASRGLQVAAVDNGALAPSIARDPNVEHVRADGLNWRPKRAVEWLVCDILEKPTRIAALVADWLASGRARNAIFNLAADEEAPRRGPALRRAIRDRLDAPVSTRRSRSASSTTTARK
jgi:23S rRNA (cytidine2498-2'-O)-methyltransferase